jgi:hypothetical protein
MCQRCGQHGQTSASRLCVSEAHYLGTRYALPQAAEDSSNPRYSVPALPHSDMLPGHNSVPMANTTIFEQKKIIAPKEKIQHFITTIFFAKIILSEGRYCNF